MKFYYEPTDSEHRSHCPFKKAVIGSAECRKCNHYLFGNVYINKSKGEFVMHGTDTHSWLVCRMINRYLLKSIQKMFISEKLKIKRENLKIKVKK
jgi:hypothetical protein